MTHGDRIASDAQADRYEALYGSPELRGLDDPEARPWPLRAAIRTIGQLEEIPGRGRTAEASPGLPGGGGDWDNPYAVYRICRSGSCLALVPVEEMRTVFEGPVSLWVRQDVEVIGAIDELKAPGVDPRTPPMGFLVWSVFEAPTRPARRDERHGSTLEPLVRYPQGAGGRVVTVAGTFRGANLFEDPPSGSRRRGGDWVLKDGPFSIWVTGKEPRGEGWSLDPRSRADCAWRVEVQGQIEVVGGFIYLRARSLSLIRRIRDEGE